MIKAQRRFDHLCCIMSRTRRKLVAAIAIVLFVGLPSASLAQSCIVIDSDADLDDFRAVAMLAPTGRVAAVVATEGIARAQEGAGGIGRKLVALRDRGFQEIGGFDDDPAALQNRDRIDLD
jgi:hypothetical protein